MNHREFLKTLSGTARDELTQRSDLKGLLPLALHFGLIVLLSALILARVPGWPFLMLPQGILSVFLFTLMHETSHLTAFQRDWLNKWVCAVCGFLIILPPLWFRFFHLAHHKYTQDPKRDPELEQPKPESLRDYVVHLSGVAVWKSQLKAILLNASGRPVGGYIPGARIADVIREARIMLALYLVLIAGSLLAGSAAILWLWLVPLILGQPFLRLFLLAEHGHCPLVVDMFANSRTTFTNRIIRFLSWNMPYHAEHHAYPMVPFHQLPRLHALCRDHLQVTERGYARFNRNYVAALGADET